MNNTRRNYSPEFRLEAAQLVVDSGYMLKTLALAPEQRRIQELEKQVRCTEMEEEVLKKAAALLMPFELNSSR